ncbi:MAG TPA: SOS response-associated peptidase [Micromonosporaceae bacterium]|nr:SOS response-associated peptidase [Micromonosporaceae bacterium]
MCGRYATTRTAPDLAALFEAYDATDAPLAPDYNVAPTDPVPVCRVSASRQGRVIEVARWGLVPSWAADRRSGARMINARAETVATARAFARSFAGRRCLIPADGWYEFAVAPAGGHGKQPYFMTPRDGSPVVFGGLWTVWGPADDRLLTCSIVTTAAVGELAEVHDRMPLLLPPQRWEAWLTAATDLDALLVAPSSGQVEALEIRAVGRAVGDVRNDGPELIAPLAGAAPLGSTRHAAAPDPVDLTLF